MVDWLDERALVPRAPNEEVANLPAGGCRAAGGGGAHWLADGVSRAWASVDERWRGAGRAGGLSGSVRSWRAACGMMVASQRVVQTGQQVLERACV